MIKSWDSSRFYYYWFSLKCSRRGGPRNDKRQEICLKAVQVDADGLDGDQFVLSRCAECRVRGKWARRRKTGRW